MFYIDIDQEIHRHRPGDIELVDFIEPTQLIEPTQPAPIYYSEILGREDTWYQLVSPQPISSSIICPLENSINTDFILRIIILILFAKIIIRIISYLLK
jgi:hypothetical protein